MKLIALKKYVIYDSIHANGAIKKIYYLQGKGIINPVWNFNKNPEEIA
ncbi:MAG: hypothetical protein AABX16_03835 [Nanoarchaeota archaeon]